LLAKGRKKPEHYDGKTATSQRKTDEPSFDVQKGMIT
jgi:hypothetical protein